jgi:hypothetical protein
MDQPGIFKHKALDLNRPQIRLVQIHQTSLGLDDGSELDVIRCSINTFDIDTSPPYTALSYVWGPPEPSNEIIISEQKFTIRKNLHDFFLQARNLRLEECFWIDQLCIDQADLGERNHQVAMMGQIFSEAKHTISWLGSDLPAYLKDVNFTQLYGPGSNDDTSRAWKSVFKSTYWTRLWVIQEICLSQEVSFLIRDIRLSWAAICGSLIASTPHLTNRLIEVDQMRKYRFEKHRKRTLGSSKVPPWFYCTFLRHCSGLDCADPRDQVYGLGSLLDGRINFRPDYSLAVEDVYEGLVQSDLCQVKTWEEVIGYMNLCRLFSESMGLHDREDIILKLNVRSYYGRKSEFVRYIRPALPEASIGELVRNTIEPDLTEGPWKYERDIPAEDIVAFTGRMIEIPLPSRRLLNRKTRRQEYIMQSLTTWEKARGLLQRALSTGNG